jgi:hypothetical protein
MNTPDYCRIWFRSREDIQSTSASAQGSHVYVLSPTALSQHQAVGDGTNADFTLSLSYLALFPTELMLVIFRISLQIRNRIK